jgi:thiol-disulfide isomerase/thioredoxin
MKTGWFAALLCLAVAAASPARAGTRVGESPALSVKTLNGGNFDLAQQRGKVVLVHFWATWCTPCITEMPALLAFYQRYRARGVEIVALSEDRTRDIDEVHHMMHHMNMDYPVAMAHQAQSNGFGDPSALPVTFVVDGQGRVRAEMRPDTLPVTEENLAKLVDPLLAAPN